MKIGILTFHRAHNYGACLQAIATRIVLEEMEHEVYYLDYWPEYHKSRYALLSWSRLKKGTFRQKIGYIRKCMSYLPEKMKRVKNFKCFIRHYIEPYCKDVNESFDIIVYGSDQIWRKQPVLGSINPVYFGQNSFHTKKNVSYAASMGILPENQKDIEQIHKLLTNLDKISVREDDLKSFVYQLGFENVEKVLDPTLLLSKNKWESIFNLPSIKGEKYVLVYIVTSNGFNMDYVNAFAASKGMKVKLLKGTVSDHESNSIINTAGPLEFLSLIKNAEFVFSSSFHGVAFSILFEKQFFASFTENEGRAKSILDDLGISERLIPAGSVIPADIEAINYNSVDSKLSQLRNLSINFLSQICVN